MGKLYDAFEKLHFKVRANNTKLADLGTLDSNGNPVLAAPGRPDGYLQVRPVDGQEGSTVVTALNLGVAPIYNARVRIERDPLYPDQYQITQIDPKSLLANPTTSPPNVPFHRHYIGSGLDDPVELRRLIPGRVWSSGGLTINVDPCPYQWNGTDRVFAGITGTDVSSHVPGTGLQRVVAVELDPTNDTISLVDGSPIAIGFAPTLSDLLAISYTGKILLGGVILANGQTNITEPNMLDPRPYISAVTAGILTSLSVTAPIVNTGTSTAPIIGLATPLALQYGGSGSDLHATGPGYLQQATNGAVVTLVKSNLTAIVAPTTTDDAAHGYAVDSRWIDTVAKKAYVCVDATTGSAVWDSTTTGSLLTTKGDLLTYSTTDVRLGVGGDGTFLLADSGATTGNRWGNNPTFVTVAGTAGAGYYEAPDQASAPGTPSAGFRLFSDSSHRLSWKGQNGFVRTFDGTANTADRVYTLPNASGTIALTNSTGQGYVMLAPTVSADNTVSGTTLTIDLLTLKTTDDNTTKRAFRVLSSANAELAYVGPTGLAVFAGINSTPVGATTASTGAFTTITAAPPVNSSGLAISGYSLTGSSTQGALTVSGTWNTSGAPTALSVTMTDTSSSANATLMKLTVGSTDEFSFRKDGALFMQGLGIFFGTNTAAQSFMTSARFGCLSGQATGTAFFTLTHNNSHTAFQIKSNSDMFMQPNQDGNVGIGTTSPAALLDVDKTDTATAAISTAAILQHTLTTANAGTANIGVDLIFKVADSTSAIGVGNQVARIRNTLPVATHASRTGLSIWSANDASAERDVIGIGANGSAGLLGFYATVAAAPIAQPTTAIAAATFVANTSGIANDTATWGGYTVGQVVKALQNLGLLA